MWTCAGEMREYPLTGFCSHDDKVQDRQWKGGELEWEKLDLLER